MIPLDCCDKTPCLRVEPPHSPDVFFAPHGSFRRASRRRCLRRIAAGFRFRWLRRFRSSGSQCGCRAREQRSFRRLRCLRCVDDGRPRNRCAGRPFRAKARSNSRSGPRAGHASSAHRHASATFGRSATTRFRFQPSQPAHRAHHGHGQHRPRTQSVTRQRHHPRARRRISIDERCLLGARQQHATRCNLRCSCRSRYNMFARRRSRRSGAPSRSYRLIRCSLWS
jgi:hypothetical protein